MSNTFSGRIRPLAGDLVEHVPTGQVGTFVNEHYDTVKQRAFFIVNVAHTNPDGSTGSHTLIQLSCEWKLVNEQDVEDRRKADSASRRRAKSQ